MMADSTSISVFFPCYNDSQTIGVLIDMAIGTLKKVVGRYEVIVIDDGSTDGSQEVLKAYQQKYPKTLRVVFHKKNQGYGGALRHGFKKAKYDLVFYTDGDGQYDIRELPILLNLMTKDVNFVNGIKMERHDYAHRIVLGNLYAFVIRWLFLLPIYDVDCDYRLIRRTLLEKIKLESSSGAICTELVKKAQFAGGKFRQVSVHHFPREYGESQYFKLRHLIRTFRDLSNLWWRLMFAKKNFNGKNRV